MADRFDCDNCKESLYGRKYIQSDDSPYCIPCYDSLFSNTCDECKELIGHDARVRHPFLHDQTCYELSIAQQQYQVENLQNFHFIKTKKTKLLFLNVFTIFIFCNTCNGRIPPCDLSLSVRHILTI